MSPKINSLSRHASRTAANFRRSGRETPGNLLRKFFKFIISTSSIDNIELSALIITLDIGRTTAFNARAFGDRRILDG